MTEIAALLSYYVMDDYVITVKKSYKLYDIIKNISYSACENLAGNAVELEEY